jgi:lipoprotein-releasing system permease protein
VKTAWAVLHAILLAAAMWAVWAFWALSRYGYTFDIFGYSPSGAFVTAFGGYLVTMWLVAILFPGALSAIVRAFGRGLWRFIGPELGLTFAGLTFWTRRLPVLRGSMWTLKDTLVRAGAVLAGVLFVLWILSKLLPMLLNRLEKSKFESFIAARHVRSQKSGFLTVISVLSICGVAVSSCAQSSVLSVLGGFREDLRRKILGNNAHIVVDTESQAPWEGGEEVLAKIRATKGVVAATPVVSGEVMISSPSNLAGVIVRGVDPGSIGSVIDLVKNIEVGKFEYLEDPEKLLTLPSDEVIGIGPGGEQYLKGIDLSMLPDDLHDPFLDPAVKATLKHGPPLRPGIIIGRELAKTLHVYLGDELTLVSPMGDLGPMGIMPRTKKFRVAAIFFSGMYEYDSSQVYTLLDVARGYLDLNDKYSAVDIRVDEADRADQLVPVLTAAMGRPDLRVRDWHEINKTLFGALKLEQFATHVILSVLTIVASFCIICTLLLMVTEKGKEIAILKALGASDSSVLRTFMVEGVIIGAIGTVFGVTTGFAVCMGLEQFGLRLDPDVYYIDRLPIKVSALDFFIVALSALTICTLATLYPAKAASKLRPVDGLRYE